MITNNRFFFLLLLFTATACSHEETSDRPNVLFITVDDMNGWGVKNYYPAAQMPYFEQLKSQSYNFTKAICPSPVCVPSRAAFFSGVAPHKTGAYHNGSDPWRRSEILRRVEAMPECFKRNGYSTFGRGKIFHAKLDEGREEAMFDNRPIYKGGFGPFGEETTWVGGKGKFQSVKAWEGPDTDFPDVVNADATIEFLQQQHDAPFFCYLGLWRPHTPYTAPKRFFDRYEDSDITYPAGYRAGDLDDVPSMGLDLVDSLGFFGPDLETRREVFREMIRGYLATSSFADWSVGRVIEALDASPYAENTIVVVASDNGYHMGEKEKWQKGTLWELSAYSPLLVRLPNGKSLEMPQTVSLMDIYPTLLEYCRLDGPKHDLDGESLLSLIENPDRKRSPSFMSYGEEYSSVYDGRYRYIRYPDDSHELYDHDSDPHEWDNIASAVNSQPIIQRLALEIPKTFVETLGGRTEAMQKISGLPKNFKNEPSAFEALLNTGDIRIRDPFILPVVESKTYYMYAQIRNRLNEDGAPQGVEVYTSKDLMHWTPPKPVLQLATDFWSRKSVWAPEVHFYQGAYYLLVTLTSEQKISEAPNSLNGETQWKRGTHIFRSEKPEGPFEVIRQEGHTPVEWMSLDGTLWLENGQPHLVFCHEWAQTLDGTIDLVALSPDLSRPVGKPQQLFKASGAPWVRNMKDIGYKRNGLVTDGPYFYRNSKAELIMIWSSFGVSEYAIGQARSETGSVFGPWTQIEDPLVAANGGHGMIFDTFDGQMMLAYHQPNSRGKERMHLERIGEDENGLLRIIK